jgi:hypothetical protein
MAGISARENSEAGQIISSIILIKITLSHYWLK